MPCGPLPPFFASLIVTLVASCPPPPSRAQPAVSRVSANRKTDKAALGWT